MEKRDAAGPLTETPRLQYYLLLLAVPGMVVAIREGFDHDMKEWDAIRKGAHPPRRPRRA